MVSQAAVKLASQASSLGAKHIADGSLRIQFTREVSYYARVIVDEVALGKKSVDHGLKDLKEEQDSLLSQAREVSLRGAGVISGALQFAA